MNRFLLATAVLAILAVTLVPGERSLVPEPTGCLICGDLATSEAVLNGLLFVPLGIGLALFRLRVSRVALLGLLASAVVETILVPIPGRDPSWGDIALNTLGAVAGALLARSPLVRRDLDPRRAAGLSLVVTLAALSVVVATGVLLQPRFPPSTYYGQWTPELGHLDTYDGTVLEASVGTLAIPPTRMTNSSEVRDSLRHQSAIRVVAVAAPSTVRTSSILSVYDDRQREIFLVGSRGDDLVFRYRTVAASARFDQPDIRVVAGMRDITPGDTLRVVIEHGRRSTCISVNARQHCNLGFTLGSGWGILLFAELLPHRISQLLNTAWLAVLVLPIGFLARATPLGYAAGGLLLTGVVFLPGPLGLLPTPVYEWVGGLLGMAVGFGLRRRARFRPSTSAAAAD